MYTGFDEKQMCLTTPNNATISFDIQLDFQIFNNNTWEVVDPQHHGIVFADSESIDGSEFISSLVNANSNWYIIDKPSVTNTNSNVWNTAYNIKSKDTTLNNVNYKHVYIDNLNGNQQGATTLMYGKGVNNFKSLTLKGSGITHIMLGYFINHDPSNATGYDNAMHFQEIVQSNTGGTFITLQNSLKFSDIANMSIPGADLSTNTYFGNPPNVNNPYGDSLTNLDALSPIGHYYKGHNTNSVKFSITATNKFNTSAYVYVFLDLNQNKIFSPSEAYPVIKLPPNTIDTTLTITWENINFDVADYVVRFRITTDSLIDFANTTNLDERSTGLARNGEVTDRILMVLPIEFLPLKLIDFTASVRNDAIILNWHTGNEEEMIAFDIQHATDAKNWITIGSVEAKNQMDNHYTFAHTYSNSKQHYYRLQMRESNDTTYSKIITVNCNMVNTNYKIAPNPTSDKISVLNINKPVSVALFTSYGTLVGNYNLSQQQSTISLASLPIGIYYLQIEQQVFKIERI